MATDPRLNRETPFGVALIAILVAIIGILYILMGISSFGVCSAGILTSGLGHGFLDKAITGLLYICLGGFSVVLSRGLYKLENWAWWSACIVEGFAALTSVSGLNILMFVVAIVALLYLVSKRHLFIF